MNQQTIILGTKSTEAWKEMERVDGNVERMWRNAMSKQMNPFLIAAIGIAERQRLLLGLYREASVFRPSQKRVKLCKRGGSHACGRNR